MENKAVKGHFSAALTIFIWGVTFISTKVLLKDFQPVEILFIRFVIGYAALWLISPRRLRLKEKKQELTFLAAGLCGICLYYLLENIALTFTLASNVGVIISAAPFFTAILTRLTGKGGLESKLGIRFLSGFAVAITGICLISFGGSRLEVNPTGDILALAAAFLWACYSVLSRKTGEYGYPTVPATRRSFAWGLLFMLPVLLLSDLRPGLERFTKPENIGNILFLGLGASALCFVTWNYAVRRLGAVKTSVYIYLVPVITVVTSAVVLGEKMTAMSIIGTVLTVAGLVISEWKSNEKKKEE